MFLKKTGLSLCVLFALNSKGQQLVRATDVTLVSSAGTKLVMTGGITFKGTSNFINNGETYLYKNTGTNPEGWLDSTAAGVMDISSTGNVFFNGSFLQSFFGKTRFYDLTIRNAVGDTLLSSCEVRNLLHLDTGFVFTKSGLWKDSLLVSNPSTTAISSSSNYTRSWVNGRLSRLGNSTVSFYLFPIGKTDSLYAPIKLTKINTNNATWTAEYFDGFPYDYLNVFNPPINHISRVEYWEITSNTIGADDDAKVSLSWRGHSRVASGLASGARDSLLVAQYINRPGMIWDNPAGWVTGNNSGTDSLSGYVNAPGLSGSFDTLQRRFTIGTESPFNNLPLKLLYFTALADGNKVRLNWNVTNEQDMRVYEVEKSLTANGFSLLSTVNSLQRTQALYTDYDPAPATGWNYYRLKMIDKTGNFSYSPVRAVKFDKGMEDIKIFPNPAVDILNIQLPSSYINKVTLQVYGSDGKFISSIKPISNMVELKVMPLASGTYFLQVLKEDGSKQTYRFVKQ